MPLTKIRMHRFAAYTIGAGIILAAAAGLSALSTDRILEDGFGRALSGTQTTTSISWTAPRGANVSQVALLSEDGNGGGYGINHLVSDAPAVLPKPLTVGDRISITSADGAVVSLEITALSEHGGDVTRIDTSLVPSQIILVSARIVGDDSGRQVRFIVESDLPAFTLPARAPDRTL